MITTNISDFRANIKRYVEQVVNDGSSIIINRGKTAAVLISLEEYNSIRETEDLIRAETIPDEIPDAVSALKSEISIPVNIDDL